MESSSSCASQNSRSLSSSTAGRAESSSPSPSGRKNARLSRSAFRSSWSSFCLRCQRALVSSRSMHLRYAGSENHEESSPDTARCKALLQFLHSNYCLTEIYSIG